MSPREILENWLSDNGYDGFCNGDNKDDGFFCCCKPGDDSLISIGDYCCNREYPCVPGFEGPNIYEDGYVIYSSKKRRDAAIVYLESIDE